MELEKNCLVRKNRNKEIRVRFTEDEKKQINELAKNKGMTASDYIRYCITLDVDKTN
ncbi:plasmid mobilization protein [Clostridium tarantellae]|uniref:plasmid mobilization protein n=1 Tax=Clostridium tarantellae TaxID=39493 RepID=UPI00147949A4|nr:hypothetical protein [Clostridium tarantellae]